ncbi:unnamed protein product [Sphagnum troendelagicum]|uniref:U3 small nucleolar RNA-associated protein 25 n=1 Tax=Sphagnum troendelagicum TaxID=128251 RepID=A0ABP0TL67_9BRYO
MKRKGGSSQRGGGRGGGRAGRRGGGRGGGRVGRGRSSDQQARSNGVSKRGRSHHGTTQPDYGKPPAEEDENENEEGDLEEPTSAYTTLLQTLQATSGSFSRAIAQRYLLETLRSKLLTESEEDDEDERGEEDAEAMEFEEVRNGVVDGLQDAGNGELEEKDGSLVDASEEEVHEEEVELQMSEEDADNPDMLASRGSTGASTDPFKVHLEHDLTKEEIVKLLEAKAKFKLEVAAAGFPQSKWVSNMFELPKEEKTLGSCGVKARLWKHWQGCHGHMQYGDFRSEQQAQFFSLCNSYADILHSRRYGSQDSAAAGQEHESAMDAYILHILNHILKTRDLVSRNNEKLQHQHANELGGKSRDAIDPPRDQGFTRPKVLVLLPLRSTALKFVKRLIELAPSSQTVDIEHKGRFFDDFGAEGDEEETNQEVEADPPTKRDKDISEGFKGGKPADFRALFSGNNDDHFRIGLKFTRKSIKLYSEFYSSDIIISSPIGLVTLINEAETAKKEEKDTDFLTSIEIAVLDYADVILMQNWSHVLTVFEHLNRIPTNQHGTDFMRIREWYLNGHARHYRQTIILSAFSDAGVNALFSRTCVNHASKVKLRCEYTGVLSKVVLQVRQVYERVECQAITEVDDARFEFFTTQIFPRIKDTLQGGILLFVRSYFDFVRLRNYLKAQNSSFCLLGEYTKQSDISRGRSWFYHGKRRIMLYTERAHFYHRYKIRGIRNLMFYSLPNHPQFYAEISNLLEGVENPSCTVLFSKFDNLQLERIVGTSRAQRMLNSKTSTFMFC